MIEERTAELAIVWEKYINVKKQAPKEQKHIKSKRLILGRIADYSSI